LIQLVSGGEYIPDGFSFDEASGILTGNPSEAGSFPCVITVVNYDIDHITDILYEDLAVLPLENAGHIKEQPDVCIYPNPIKNTVSISTSQGKEKIYLLEVISSTGKLLEKKLIGNEMTKLDCTNYPAGLFLFRFTNLETGVVSLEKAIKE